MKIRGRRISLHHQLVDSAFDYVILLSSVLTILFLLVSIPPLIIVLPEYWHRLMALYGILGFFAIRGLLLWRKEVR